MMRARPQHPPPLEPGSRVALVSPAGPLRGDLDVARGISNARSLGWEPAVGRHVLARDGYFAGADALRLADLQQALDDPAIDGIWCLRGGYGAMRLLTELDWFAAADRRVALIGFSDITALHLAAGREGLVTYHGPVARGVLGDFSRRSLLAAVVERCDPCGVAPEGRTLRSGTTSGRLAGGNLALLAALAGTHFAPSFDGAIAVFEDVNEAVYRIDRMLVQLRLAGAFDGCRGIVFGQFTEFPEQSDDGRRPLDDVLAETADAVGVPCFAGAPIGHVDDQWTLPLGATAEMDADERRLTVAPPPSSP